ncbi:MAG: glycosyltransferase family 4 protein [Prevotellaceae bacterium]|nr:glycosyltransferase family 4 protein [Prevotellaceae bacterium]
MAYASPEKAASNYLGDNRNETFAEQGWIMEVFVPTPCRGLSEEDRKKYKSNKYRREEKLRGSMRINRFSMFREGNNAILRALRYALISLKQIYHGIFSQYAKDCDVIFTNSTPPIQGAVSAIIKKYKKIPLVYNLQDIFPDSLVNNGLAKKGGVLWKIGRVIENFTYKHADKIIVISEDFKKNIMAKGVPEEKIVVVYNWVDQHAVVDIPRDQNKLFDAYGLDRNKFYITYNGNIGLSQNMDMLLEVAKSLRTNPDIQFVLVGDGAYLDEVKRIVAENQLDNVHLLPFQPYEDISHVFSLGDVSLVISKPGTGAASVPSKTWSIMSASRPVLANFDENELKEIVNKHRCGIFTKAGDKEAFVEGILRLYNDRGLCKEYGRNGRQFVMDNLTREVGTGKYVEVIKSVVKQ